MGNGAVRTALIIIDPPSLNQALRLGQSFELADIAAQGKNIADDVRAIEARSELAPARAATSATIATNAGNPERHHRKM